MTHTDVAALALSAAILAGCHAGLTTDQRSAAEPQWVDLGIADDPDAPQPAISTRQIRVLNRGPAPAEATLSLAVIDSIGNILSQYSPHSSPIHIPPAELGGKEGIVVSIIGEKSFDSLVDSLAYSGSRFGIRASLKSTQSDGDLSDNTRTREWGRWLTLRPGSDLVVPFSFAVPMKKFPISVQIVASRIPPNAKTLLPTPLNLVLQPGLHSLQLRLVTSQHLPHGSIFAAEVRLTNSISGELLQQHEQIAIYDTIPPALSSYRAVLFDDRRVAIQVQASDRHAGLSEDAVATIYSTDSGATWRFQGSRAIEDDFGRNALFESVIGPFQPHADILICLAARDRVGNTNYSLPIDAAVFAAPVRAEMLLDSVRAGVGGNVVFSPLQIARISEWLEALSDTAATHHVSARQATRRRGISKFEYNRLRDLRSIPDALQRWGIDVSQFRRLAASRVSAALRDDLAITALRIEVRDR